MKKKAKKRNPNDATMRNIRAMNKRIDVLETEFKELCQSITYFTEAFSRAVPLPPIGFYTPTAMPAKEAK